MSTRIKTRFTGLLVLALLATSLQSCLHHRWHHRHHHHKRVVVHKRQHHKPVLVHRRYGPRRSTTVIKVRPVPPCPPGVRVRVVRPPR